MLNIGDKLDNTAGASGELSADEYNDHKNEIQEAVEVTGQTLSQVKTPDQLGRAMFINGTCAQSFSDSGTANQIILTPKTGASGLIVPDAYAQMDGMIVIFDKSIATTSTSVTVNIGQTTGSLLGAKNLNGAVIGMDGTIALRYNLGSDYWEAISLYNDNSYTKAEIDQSFNSVGFIKTELVISGSNLLIKKPKIAVEETIGTRIIYDSSSDTTIDITGLTASTWYAIVIREDTGIISAQTISTFATGGGGNWDTTGLANNQLDMYDSLYDFDRKYCRAYDGTNYYRVFGIALVNSTPNGIDYLFYIPNFPKSEISIYRSTNQAISLGSIIVFNTCRFDINSEADLSTGIVTIKKEGIYITTSFINDVTTAFTGSRDLLLNIDSTNVARGYWEVYTVATSLAIRVNLNSVLVVKAGETIKTIWNSGVSTTLVGSILNTMRISQK